MIAIHHTTTDGRQFITIYGEVDPHSITVKVGDTVNQGDLLAKSGVLMKAGNIPLSVVNGHNVSMLHFEAYSGAAGFNATSKLNGSVLPAPFHRRADLMDSLTILQEGYHATFLDALPLPPVGDRIPIAQLHASSAGKSFIQTWEGVKYDHTKQNTFYYDDNKGYCTVGWGHLIDKKSCTTLGFTPLVSKISLAEAQAYFEQDVLVHEAYVKETISVPLYQYEFDALLSLAFNVGHISKIAPKFCSKLNAQDYIGAPVEFLDMENATRRQSEHNLFCNNIYDASH
ncbi:glycoside hydrolase family protein [Paraburkholderia xenovorans]